VALIHLNKRTYKNNNTKTPESIMFTFPANIDCNQCLQRKRS